MWALTLVFSPAGSDSSSLWTVLGKQGFWLDLAPEPLPQGHSFKYIGFCFRCRGKYFQKVVVCVGEVEIGIWPVVQLSSNVESFPGIGLMGSLSDLTQHRVYLRGPSCPVRHAFPFIGPPGC